MNYETFGKIDTTLSFGKAFDTLRELDAKEPGKYGMRLSSWKPDVVIRIQNPDDNSYMTAPYLYVQSRYGRVPWKETMIELFSDSWYIVKFVDKEIEEEPEQIRELTATAKKTPYLKKDLNKIDKFHEELKNLNNNCKLDNIDRCSDKCLKRCLDECKKVKRGRKTVCVVDMGSLSFDELDKFFDLL